MSEATGANNPTFNNQDESHKYSISKNSQSSGQEQVTLEIGYGMSEDVITRLRSKSQQSFVSQHYTEPTQKFEATPIFPEKVKGVHENGNEDNVSFLSTSINSTHVNNGEFSFEY